MVVVESEDVRDFGTISLDDSQRIVRFEEKKRVRNPLLMQAFIFSKKEFFLSYPLMSDIP